jgi:hypothetical protein
MVLNQRSWELVKEGNFIVGDRPLCNKGVTYNPGDDYPSDDKRTLFALYDTNQISEKIEAPKKSKKRKA